MLAPFHLHSVIFRHLPSTHTHTPTPTHQKQHTYCSDPPPRPVIFALFEHSLNLSSFLVFLLFLSIQRLPPSCDWSPQLVHHPQLYSEARSPHGYEMAASVWGIISGSSDIQRKKRPGARTSVLKVALAYFSLPESHGRYSAWYQVIRKVELLWLVQTQLLS